MSRSHVATFVSFLLTTTCETVAGDAFLSQNGRGPYDVDAELRSAMAAVMGCGATVGSSPHDQVDSIKLALTPMWKSLPKNRWGRVEWRMLRYAAHRYFMQQSSLLIKGLEPTRLLNSSAIGSAHILSETGDVLVDTALVGKVNGKGFSLEDVAFMIATLEQVVFVGESARLDRAYRESNHNPSEFVTHDQLSSIMETYMMLWMLGDDEESIAVLLKKPSLKRKLFPFWNHVRNFAVGIVTRMEFEASRSPTVGFGRSAIDRTYSFEDAHQAVGHITKNFASFWEAECQSIKESLTDLDEAVTGRIPLPEFYGANADGEWRFGESEAYLRELGALDESSTLRGKQVIIPNYLQGASNCIVSTPHYLVCCINECESMLTDIEQVVGAPVASVEAILDTVRRMSNFQDEQPRIDGALARQLQSISQMHGGHVPLHGRLFAQWMHFVFPQQCPFPHKIGTTSATSLMEFGVGSTVSESEVAALSAKRNTSARDMDSVAEAQWMSQWSEEEDVEMGVDLGLAPWESSGMWLGYGCGTTAILGLAWSLAVGAVKAFKASGQPAVASEFKSHFV